MKACSRVSVLLAAGVLICAGTLGPNFNLQAAEPGSPEALRRHAAELQEQVANLKAAGHHEEAMRLQREIEELWQHAAELRADRDRGRREERPAQVAPERRPRQERQEIELEERIHARHAAEVGELTQEIARLHEELAARRPRPPQAPFDEPRWRGPEREEFERQVHHVKVAIENLHAAGLHEIAERLEQELDRRRERPPEPMPPAEAMERINRELDELRHQLEEVRVNLRELRQQVAEWHR